MHINAKQSKQRNKISMLCIVVTRKYGNALVSIPIGDIISFQESMIDSYSPPIKESRCHMNNNDPVLVIDAHVTPYWHKIIDKSAV